MARLLTLRILLLCVAFVSPIATIGYLQISDLDRSVSRVRLERDGIICLSHGYAILRALAALEGAGDPAARSAVRAAFAGYASSRRLQRDGFATLAGVDLRTARSRYDVGRAVGNQMKNVADSSYLAFDPNPVVNAAALAMAYSLSDAVPLLVYVSTLRDRIDVVKTRAAAASRLETLDDSVAELLHDTPRTERILADAREGEKAKVDAYFRILKNWERQPATPRPEVLVPMRASVGALNELFAALTGVLDAASTSQRRQLEGRRTVALGSTLVFLMLAMGIAWFAAHGLLRRHRRELARFEELALKEARFQAIFAGSPLPIAITDVSGVVVECNDAYLELVGLAVVQAGRTPLFAPSRPHRMVDIARLLEPVRAHGGTNEYAEVTLSREDGTALCCHVTATLVRTPGDASVLCAVMLLDVTERQRREHRLHHAATHDALTGITNRAYLFAQLERRLRQLPVACRFALLFLDVDDFKSINDRLGHAAGDACLVAIGRRLRSRVRTGDVVARYGGDEFAILLCDPESIDDVDTIAARLRQDVAAPIEFGDTELRVSSSIGVALDDGAAHGDADRVIAAADRAMYADKSRGVSRAAAIRGPSA